MKVRYFDSLAELENYINKNNPVKIRIGPNALFMYFCKKFAITGTLRIELIMTKPNVAYESILPIV